MEDDNAVQMISIPTYFFKSATRCVNGYAFSTWLRFENLFKAVRMDGYAYRWVASDNKQLAWAKRLNTAHGIEFIDHVKRTRPAARPCHTRTHRTRENTFGMRHT